jgi:hypothetical protein
MFPLGWQVFPKRSDVEAFLLVMMNDLRLGGNEVSSFLE